MKRLALYCYSAGEHAGALEALGRLKALVPEDLEVIENIGVILRLGGRTEEAVENLLEVHRLDPARVNVCDALAHCYASLGREEEMQRFGRLSLELKDREAAGRTPLRTLSEISPPAFVPGEKNRHVISFSLWGTNPRYLQGALRNVVAAMDVYPDWICRFYCDDSVPVAILDQLRGHGAEVVMRPRPSVFYEGLLWRFEVVNDPGISHFLVRDCDSVVNVKERVAVDEWLQSGKWFHAMRDFASHTEVILAGMWGGIAGVLPSVEELRREFKPITAPTRTYDQHLLRECVWPVVRQSVLIHDSVYTACLGSVAFPRFGTLPPNQHVGQNEAAVKGGDPLGGLLSPTQNASESARCPLFVLNGIDEIAILHLVKLLRQIGGVTIFSESRLSDLRLRAADYVAGLTHVIAPDSADLGPHAENTFLHTLKGITARNAGQGVGFLDVAESLESLLSLADSFELKILCAIRDPRDTASSQRLADSNSCRDLAETWVRHLEAISAANRVRPGLVEIVRYEDLRPETCIGTLARISKFLGTAPKSPLIPESIDTVESLPGELLSLVEERTAHFLAKLRYSKRTP